MVDKMWNKNKLSYRYFQVEVSNFDKIKLIFLITYLAMNRHIYTYFKNKKDFYIFPKQFQ